MKNHNLTSHQRIAAFSALGNYMETASDSLHAIIEQAGYHNSWFTPANTKKALHAIAKTLVKPVLADWIQPYLPDIDPMSGKTVGLVLAGNIPLVGFHDILTALIAGFKVQIKLSSDDKYLIPHLLDKLIEFEPAFKQHISLVDRLQRFDMIIATGSNNTARYFEYYFKNVPHIIRKNRNSVAVIWGDETKAELSNIGYDLFDYYGLGCRNVSKLYFPKNYEISYFFEAIETFSTVINHHKYHNNYDYNKSIYLVNGDRHYDNGFLLLKEDQRLASPLAVAYYEHYNDIESLTAQLNERNEEIQCIVTNRKLTTIAPSFSLGKSQEPALDDYADGVNTLAFLLSNK
ncbi:MULTISPECIES: acyl-CoA reductase [Olivibacter]|uniref:Acyl-CoA reductase n=2 Tax=Olivibacter TaxID=376469 RepID=A0ABV6HIV9_9SPHI|nr:MULTISPECIES: acyl-CoA reductase [Olivibacter]MCL4638220.1 acyl-CoA reductase [Olivibacter sp. UJ_SKK_5.1]MDX3913456.1 acyl-CoA reductase [Pseudosphingobacterium sp.]